MNSKLPSIEYISCGVGRIGAAMDVNECGANLVKAIFPDAWTTYFGLRSFPSGEPSFVVGVLGNLRVARIINVFWRGKKR